MDNSPLTSLPHAYPFRLLDRVGAISAERGTAIKNVSANEAFLQGHFPGDPVMPGVLIIEAMAQLAGLVMNNGARECGAYVAQVKDMRFRKTVAPGDSIVLSAEIGSRFGSLASFTVSANVDGVVIAAGEIVMAQTGGKE
ncbi:MAG: 3-hydroxyacyl-ACP dehydratase FabZ [Deltaproteobacteria bacterium]|nr:3-hydroxyacyl-ACP dehydratase FabZ [Deltaproteobacteria bacterium]